MGKINYKFYMIYALIAFTVLVLIGCSDNNNLDEDEADPLTGNELSELVPKIFVGSEYESDLRETVGETSYQIIYKYCDVETCKQYNTDLANKGWDDDKESYTIGTESLFKSELKKKVNDRSVIINLRCAEYWNGECTTKMTIKN